ncbi:hypothetical protein FGL54_18465 [Enterobacter cloacae]|uniref:hypothetical protein n=1 Tax=Enterobacter cloacae complex TaxID=354276 RepID=UPI0004742FA6|nr:MULTISPECIES: hypothetical protein [Enterobacter cloacae complex]MBW7591793.1 hypothetical protein [Enterobacter kobei]QCZ40004.1 hypothetical protein FGL54_18465 [Enterobacter cloacae]
MANNQSQQTNVSGAASVSQLTLPIVNDGFINVITELPASGLIAKTFICSNFDLANQTNVYYMKVYNDDKFVINEMVGYILAKASGLDVANKAYLLEIDSVTRALIDDFYKRRGLANNKEHYNSNYAFLISSAPGININTYHSNIVLQTAFFKQKISNWNKNNSLIAFDEWVANTDRNAGNILFGTNANYVIDHGSMPVQMNWTRSCLQSKQCFKNVHYINTSTVMGKNPLDVDLLNESSKHALAFSNVKNSIISIIANTVKMSPDYQEMIDFIEDRSKSVRTATYANMAGAR